MRSSRAKKINIPKISVRAQVCLGNCCFCGLTHSLKGLVMSPRIPTIGKGICAIAKHMVQCLGSATEPAHGVFHQTPPLQIFPRGQLVAHLSTHIVHLPCCACCIALVTLSCSTFRLLSWLIIAALTMSSLGATLEGGSIQQHVGPSG